MLGWLLIVRSRRPAASGIAAQLDDTVLATWETGLGGTTWLEALVAAGKAKQERGGGYPNLYAALASDLLPLLENGPPRYARLPKVEGAELDSPRMLKTYREKLAACSPDEVLTVEAWDQS